MKQTSLASNFCFKIIETFKTQIGFISPMNKALVISYSFVFIHVQRILLVLATELNYKKKAWNLHSNSLTTKYFVLYNPLNFSLPQFSHF